MDDLRWQVGGVHPSVAEIFKLMADDALARCQRLLERGRETESGAHVFRLPDLATFVLATLPPWVGQRSWRKVALACQPQILEGIYSGVSCIQQLTGHARDGASLRGGAEGGWRLNSRLELRIFFDTMERLVRLLFNSVTAGVRLGDQL